MARLDKGLKRSFDPSFFDWKDGTEERAGGKDMRIRIYKKPGQIVLTTAAARKIQECVEKAEGGFYRVKIGIAKKAIAIKPLRPDEVGFRMWLKKRGTAVISCANLIQTLDWQLPLVVPAVWDKENQMLVGIIT